MGYFIGDFRSLDQSVDPLGQKYRVVIFTGYDPNSLNNTVIGEDSSSTPVGPYPIKNVRIITDPTTTVNKKVPGTPTVLTMTNHPFNVSYVGDKSPYKPYRCSSATVSFLQSDLNTDFISTLGTNCLVILLKWKNEVSQVGNTMVNNVTGATLSKTTYQCYDFTIGDTRTYYNDFLPWEYDDFCYEIEWVGFSLPGVLNCGYEHVEDKFTLQCQDAFSALQYKKFTKPSGGDLLELEVNTLFRSLCLLGVYKDVYLTTALHYPLANDTVTFRDVPYGNATRWTCHQVQNFFNEDNEPMRWLDVIEQLMNYHSLTVVPWKNAIYVISDDAIAGGITEYDHYKLSATSNPSRLWYLPAENPTYGDHEVVNIVDTFDIVKESFCASGTQISSSNVYDEVKVACDEMHPEDMFPDMNNDENLDLDVPSSQPMETHVTQRGSTSGDNIWLYWEALAYTPAIDSIKCYHHGNDTEIHSSTAHDDIYWAPDSQKTLVTNDNLTVATDNNNYKYWEQMASGQWCCVLDDNEFPTVNSDTDVPHTASFKRKFLFSHWYALGGGMGFFRQHQSGQTYYYNYDNKTSTGGVSEGELNYQQTMLEVHSKDVLFNSHQYINLKGTWKFYRNGAANMPTFHNYPKNDIYSYGGRLDYGKDNAFIYAYVRLVPDDPLKQPLYLNCQNNPGFYSWVTDKTMSKLPLDTNITTEEYTVDGQTRHDCAGVAMDFASPIRNIDGLYFALPIVNGTCEPGHIEVLFDRQIGPTSGSSESCSTCYTLEDLELNVVSDTYVITKGAQEPEKDNTEYKNILVEDAVEEHGGITLIHSSTDRRGLSYAETCRYGVKRRTLGERLYNSNLDIVNECAGIMGIPEQLRVEGICRQFKEPLINMDFPLFRDGISPISRILWSRLSGKPMIVDSLDIDYEYEQCTVQALQIRPFSTDQVNTQRSNLTRNYFRTRDIIFNGHIARRDPITLSPETRQTGNSVEVTDSNIILTTDNTYEGASQIHYDFETGLVGACLPGSGVSITMNQNTGKVTLTTT